MPSKVGLLYSNLSCIAATGANGSAVRQIVFNLPPAALLHSRKISHSRALEGTVPKTGTRSQDDGSKRAAVLQSRILTSYPESRSPAAHPLTLVGDPIRRSCFSPRR